MEFSEFLKELAKHKNCSSNLDLFEKLGGERKTGIVLRTFRAVFSGQISPSLKFLIAIFPQVPNHLRKDAMISFFNSSGQNSTSKEISSYLAEQLNVTISDEINSIWSQGEPLYFSERQLKFLASSNEAVRLYNRLVCHSGISDSDIKTDERNQILRRLVDLDLAKRTGTGRTIPSKNLYRLPSQDNSPRELVVPANEVVLRHISAFIAKEGALEEQELGFSFHTCLKTDAKKILEQMKYFKRWVQSLALKADHPDEVSFVWVDFGRILRQGRDY